MLLTSVYIWVFLNVDNWLAVIVGRITFVIGNKRKDETIVVFVVTINVGIVVILDAVVQSYTVDGTWLSTQLGSFLRIVRKDVWDGCYEEVTIVRIVFTEHVLPNVVEAVFVADSGLTVISAVLLLSVACFTREVADHPVTTFLTKVVFAVTVCWTAGGCGTQAKLSIVGAIAESSTYENSVATKATICGYVFVLRTMGDDRVNILGTKVNGTTHGWTVWGASDVYAKVTVGTLSVGTVIFKAVTSCEENGVSAVSYNVSSSEVESCCTTDVIPTGVRISVFVLTLLERYGATDNSVEVVLRLGVCGMVTYVGFAIQHGPVPIALSTDLSVTISTIGGVTMHGGTPKAGTA